MASGREDAGWGSSSGEDAADGGDGDGGETPVQRRRGSKLRGCVGAAARRYSVLQDNGRAVLSVTGNIQRKTTLTVGDVTPNFRRRSQPGGGCPSVCLLLTFSCRIFCCLGFAGCCCACATPGLSFVHGARAIVLTLGVSTP